MTNFKFHKAILGLVFSHHSIWKDILLRKTHVKIEWLFNPIASASILVIMHPIMYWAINGYRFKDLRLKHKYQNHICLQYG